MTNEKERPESVWDYPRPPRLERTQKHLQVIFNGTVIADSDRAYRVLETSHPPVYYFPPEDVRLELLTEEINTTFCEWKGRASYYSVSAGERQAFEAAWSYPDPTGDFKEIKDHIAFYPSKMDACIVDGETAEPQEGDFYGGWITSDIAGPFKGAPGTAGW